MRNSAPVHRPQNGCRKGLCGDRQIFWVPVTFVVAEDEIGGAQLLLLLGYSLATDGVVGVLLMVLLAYYWYGHSAVVGVVGTTGGVAMLGVYY